MCRAGGRRCPSSKHPNKEQRDKTNARRRELYALKKKAQENVKVSESSTTVSVNKETQQNIINVAPLKSADEYGFSTGTLEYHSDFEREMQLEVDKEELLNNLPNSDHKDAIINYTGDLYFKIINKELRDYGNINRLKIISMYEFGYDYGFPIGDNDDCSNCGEPLEQEECENCGHENEYDFIDENGVYIDPEDIVKISDNLDDFIKEHDISEPKLVYRGFGNTGIKMAKTLSVGDEVSFESFSSTTTEPATAINFSKGIDRAVIFEMKTAHGAWVSGPEEEVILPRNTKWRMVGKRVTRMDIVADNDPTYNSTKEVEIVQLIEEKLV